VRRVLILTALSLATGCGSQAGLHVENDGHTIAVATSAVASTGGGQPVKLPRHVTARVALGGVPTLAWDGAGVWAAVWPGGPRALGSLIGIDPASGHAQAPFSLPPSTQPYLLAATSDGLFVATGRRVLRIDPADGRTVASIALGGRSRSMVESRGSLWVTVDPGALLRLESAQLRVQASIPLDGQPDAVTVVPGSVYVTDDRDHTLRRIDPGSGQPAAAVSVAGEGAGDPLVATVYGDSIWVFEGSSVVRLARRGLRVLDRITLPSGGVSMAAGTGGVWVTGRFGVARIDAGSGRLASPIRLAGGAAALATTGDAVWVADTSGNVVRLSP
jgi:streptogramin lyase